VLIKSSKSVVATMAISSHFPDLGVGLGLRSQHFKTIIEERPKVGWFEIISENFMDSGGRPRYMLDCINEHYPLVMHGVSLSIGSSDPLNMDYLKKLKKLSDEIKPAWVSDHLCWTGMQNLNTHDLLPVPFNNATLTHIGERISVVQDFLERPLVLENPSSYMQFKQSDMEEWEFLNELVAKTGCKLLCDVNNIAVSSHNNGIDPNNYIDNIRADAIVQVHLAGHQKQGDLLIDTHDNVVSDNVWRLFSRLHPKLEHFSYMLEWDDNIPPFDEYLNEANKVKHYMNCESLVQDDYAQEADVVIGDALSTPIHFMVNDVELVKPQ